MALPREGERVPARARAQAVTISRYLVDSAERDAQTAHAVTVTGPLSGPRPTARQEVALAGALAARMPDDSPPPPVM